MYEYQIALANGTYEFKFVNGGAWETINNRTITVADAATDNGTPCFDSLSACEASTVLGCTYDAADNYNACANDDDGSCLFSGSDCLGDLDGDGVAATADLLLFLSVFGSTCN